MLGEQQWLQHNWSSTLEYFPMRDAQGLHPNGSVRKLHHVRRWQEPSGYQPLFTTLQTPGWRRRNYRLGLSPFCMYFCSCYLTSTTLLGKEGTSWDVCRAMASVDFKFGTPVLMGPKQWRSSSSSPLLNLKFLEFEESEVAQTERCQVILSIQDE